MILINRGQPSPELSNLLVAKNSDSDWINIDPKDTKLIRKKFDDDSNLKNLIRADLYNAQHGLCAYCMAEISLIPSIEERKNKKIKIEHYTPISENKSLVFDYNNYFLVCTGGDSDDYSKSPDSLCCDSKKGEKKITIDPTNINHIKHLQYQEDGQIKYYEVSNSKLTKIINNDLNITLGLNGTLYLTNNNTKHDTRTNLVYRRKKAYETAFNRIKAMSENKTFTKSNLEKIISKEESNPQEFSGVFLFVYRRALDYCTNLNNNVH